MRIATLLFRCAIVAIPTTLGTGTVKVHYPVKLESDGGTVCLDHDNKTLINDRCQGKTCYQSARYWPGLDPIQVHTAKIYDTDSGALDFAVRHSAVCGDGRLML